MNGKLSSLFVIFLLVIDASLILIYILFFKQQIFIKNGSHMYQMSYRPTKEFTQVLNDWEIFNGGFRPNEQSFPVKKMVFELTDTSQNTTNVSVSAALFNSRLYYAENTVSIKIYLSKQAATLPDQALNGTVLQQILSKLYDASHDATRNTNAVNSELIPIINNFTSHPERNPIKVVRKK